MTIVNSPPIFGAVAAPGPPIFVSEIRRAGPASRQLARSFPRRRRVYNPAMTLVFNPDFIS